MKRLIISDDSLTSRLYLKKCLLQIFSSKEEEVQFLEAKNGEDALKILVETDIDLIVSDVNMPVMNGETFIKNLKNNDVFSAKSAIPVIFVTSLANEQKTVELLAAGAQAVIKKPVDVNELAQEITKLFFNNPISSTNDGGWG